jgi:hypothetical protein
MSISIKWRLKIFHALCVPCPMEEKESYVCSVVKLLNYIVAIANEGFFW